MCWKCNHKLRVEVCSLKQFICKILWCKLLLLVITITPTFLFLHHLGHIASKCKSFEPFLACSLSFRFLYSRTAFQEIVNIIPRNLFLCLQCNSWKLPLSAMHKYWPDYSNIKVPQNFFFERGPLRTEVNFIYYFDISFIFRWTSKAHFFLSEK